MYKGGGTYYLPTADAVMSKRDKGRALLDLTHVPVLGKQTQLKPASK